MKNSYTRKRLRVRLNRLGKVFGDNKPVITDIQKKSISVFRKMVTNIDSTLLVDPLTNCCYVEYGHYFIKLNSTSILIKNTTFNNYIEMDYRIGEKLISFFFKHVSERRLKMEAIYDWNTLNNLNTIYLELNQPILATTSKKK